jgi:transposase
MSRNLSKRSRIINERTLIVTVDLGKTKNYGYCRCPDGSDISPFEFLNNRAGFRKFWNRITTMKASNDLSDMVVGFESTGPYGEPLMHFLHDRGVKLVQVNCKHIKRVKEIYDNSPGKTDLKDPKVIADLLELNRFLSVVIPQGTAAELRNLIHGRERMLSRYKTLYNQLHDLVFKIFPELLQVMNDLDSKTIKHLLRHYTTPEAILELGLDRLTCILKKVRRGKIRAERAEKLYLAAQNSVGLLAGQRAIVTEIRQILDLMVYCEENIAQIEQQLSEHLKEIPYSHSLLAIKGIGIITVAGLIGEVGDFSKFRTIRELMKYAGLNLYEISSGYRQGKRRISKRGRSLMRKLLYFAALNVIKKGGILHQQYQSYLDRGMIKPKALVAISKKLLTIIHAMVRDNSQYCVNYLSKGETLKKVA